MSPPSLDPRLSCPSLFEAREQPEQTVRTPRHHGLRPLDPLHTLNRPLSRPRPVDKQLGLLDGSARSRSSSLNVSPCPPDAAAPRTVAENIRPTPHANASSAKISRQWLLCPRTSSAPEKVFTHLPTPPLTPDLSPIKDSPGPSPHCLDEHASLWSSLDGEPCRVKGKQVFLGESLETQNGRLVDYSTSDSDEGSPQCNVPVEATYARRLRPSQRKLTRERIRRSPVKSPDRFIIPRCDDGERQIQFQLKRPYPSKPQKPEMLLQDPNDPFTAPVSRVDRDGAVRLARGRSPLRSLGMPSRIDHRSPARSASSGSPPNGTRSHRALQTFFHGPSSSRGRRPPAPVYRSHFWDDDNAGNSKGRYKKCLAYALGFDSSRSILRQSLGCSVPLSSSYIYGHNMNDRSGLSLETRHVRVWENNE